jgi:hypothetical protein
VRPRGDRCDIDGQYHPPLVGGSGLHRLLVGLLAGPYASPQSEDIKHIQIAARFHFYALPENPAVRSGEFELSGTFDPDLGLLDLYPSKWIDRPDGYNLVGLRGMLEEDRQGLKGAIDVAGCGAIVLRRAADAAQDQPVQPSPGPSTPVQVEVSEELVKLNQEVYQRFKAGEFGQALPIAEQALGIAERLYGPPSPSSSDLWCKCCRPLARAPRLSLWCGARSP